MSNLLVEDENVKSSKSNFAIYDNEKIKYEGKDISTSFFAYKMQSGFFKAIDIEIINSVYILKYSTSRQITSFLNSVRNIDVNQNVITKRLSILNNSSVVGRYSFISDNRTSETGLKCYVLRERGKRLLLQREYPCTWNVYDNLLVLENIKNYLARNNYILKVLKNKIINYDNLKLHNEETMIGCSYSVNDFKHSLISMRKTDNMDQLKKLILQLEKDYSTMKNKRIIIIGEDDIHLFNIFKQILALIKKNKLNIKYLNSIIFTQDLRIVERNIDSCFVVWTIDEKAILEDVKLDEFKIIYDI